MVAAFVGGYCSGSGWEFGLDETGSRQDFAVS